jgi:hypothetical protein
MARISTYSIDALDPLDKLLGTDGTGATKNFKIGPEMPGAGTTNSSTIINYITESDPRALAFLYHNNTYGGEGSMQTGTINISNSSTTTAFSAVTTLRISKYPFAATLQASPNTAANILDEYVGERVKWCSVDDPNIYGIYECTAFVQVGSTDFYDMALTHISSNGVLTAGDNSSTTPDVYILELFGTDKNFTYTHTGSAATTWSIAHNLNKFPSVVIKVTSGKIVQADITHTNKNNLTITFSGQNSGSAYMN